LIIIYKFCFARLKILLTNKNIDKFLIFENYYQDDLIEIKNFVCSYMFFDD